MTSLSFDIFARDHYSKEFDKLSRKLRDSTKDFDTFGSRASKSFLSTANSLSNIPTAAAGLQGLGSIIGSLSGVLGLLPAAAAAAGAGIATLAVGVMGFADGLKEMADTSKIQKAATGAADAAVQSARRIEQAQVSLVRAQRSTRDAEEALTRAQLNAREAQVALTRAREQAAEQLEDLSRAVSGAALDEEAAVLGLERAQERLREARKDGASGLDLREAELGIRQAQQALEDTRDRYADLRRESEQANKAGVEGSDAVVSAQQQVADAARGVRDAQEGVADASQNVRDAQTEVARAMDDAARSAAKANSAFGVTTEAFDKLSKNAQGTVRAILGLGGAWADLRGSVQDALFAGVADDVKRLGGVYMPVLKQGMTGVATEFNTGARSVADFLAEGAQVNDVSKIFGGTRDVVGNLSDTLKPLTQILLDIATVGMEMLPGLTGGFGSAAERAAEFVRNARETGRLREWIQEGLDTLRKLGELFSNVGQIFSAVFKGLDAGGQNLLDTLISVTGKIRDFLQSVEGQSALKALGAALKAVSAVVTEVMLTAFKELAPVIVELAPGFAELARQVGTILVAALQIVGPLLVGLAGFISDNIDWLGPLAIALFSAVKAFEAVAVVMRVLAVLAHVNPWITIIAATVALATLIVTHWEEIMGFLSRAWEWIKRTAGQLWEGIKMVIVDPIVSAAKWIGDLVGNIIGFFRDIPRRIGEGLSSLASVIGNAFKGAFNFAIRAINWFIDRANDAIYGINVVNPFENVPYLPHIGELHDGGKVPGLPGTEKLAMLEAGERVFPADYDWKSMMPPPMRFGSAAGGASTPIQIVLRSDGSRLAQMQLEMLRESVRAEGGDVQLVLGAA